MGRRKKVSGKERERRRLGERGVVAWFVSKSESQDFKEVLLHIRSKLLPKSCNWDKRNDPGGHYVK